MRPKPVNDALSVPLDRIVNPAPVTENGPRGASDRAGDFRREDGKANAEGASLAPAPRVPISPVGERRPDLARQSMVKSVLAGEDEEPVTAQRANTKAAPVLVDSLRSDPKRADIKRAEGKEGGASGRPTVDDAGTQPSEAVRRGDVLQLAFWAALAVAVGASAVAIAWPSAVGRTGPILLIAMAAGGIIFLLWLLRGAGRRIGLFPVKGAAEALVNARRQPNAWLEALDEPAVLCDRDGAPFVANAAYMDLARLIPGAPLTTDMPLTVEQLLGSARGDNSAFYRLSKAASNREVRRELLPPVAFNDGETLRQFEAIVTPAGPNRSLWRLSPVEGIMRGLAGDGRSGYIEEAPIGFLSARMDGEIVYLNAALRAFLGLPDDAKGLKIADIMSGPNLKFLSVDRRSRTDSTGEVFLKSRSGVNALARVVTRWSVLHGSEPLSRTVVLLPNTPAGSPARRIDAPSEFKPSGSGESYDASSDLFTAAPIGVVRLQGSTITEAVIVDANPQMLTLTSGLAVPGANFASLFTTALGAVEPEVGLAQLGSEAIHLALAAPTETHVKVWLVNDAAGLPVAAYFADITESRQLERRVLQAEKQQMIITSGRSIAHEINNNLQAIQMCITELKKRHPFGDPDYDFLNQMTEASGRCATQVKAQLAIARNQTLKLEVVNITEQLSQSISLLRVHAHSSGGHVQLIAHHGRDLPLILVDKAELHTVLTNLIINARDAIGPKDGNVELRTSRSNGERAIQDGQTYVPFGDYLLIEVTDSGPGIPAEIMPKIFNELFTTKAQDGKGTGIGLATCMGLVKQFKGYIYAVSPKGAGATFRIFLPAYTGQLVPESEQPRPQRRDLSGRGRILLVEDEPVVSRLLASALTGHGYHVVVANDGEEGVDLIQQNPGGFDLILSDVSMPGLTGPLMLAAAREHLGQAQVVLMSGFSDEDLGKASTPDRPVHFLAKPFTAEQLAQLMRDLLHP